MPYATQEAFKSQLHALVHSYLIVSGAGMPTPVSRETQQKLVICPMPQEYPLIDLSIKDWQSRSRGPNVRGHRHQHRKFKASLAYVRPCLLKKILKEGGKEGETERDIETKKGRRKGRKEGRKEGKQEKEKKNNRERMPITSVNTTEDMWTCSSVNHTVKFSCQFASGTCYNKVSSSA